MVQKCPICLNEVNEQADECPACGFKFSGKTEKFKPVIANKDDSVTKKTQELKSASNKMPILRVISGPQGEIVLPISKPKMTIGRSPESDIFLNDRTVSRQHAIIGKNGDVYQIVDNDSYNGVWVNNKNESVANIKNGDLIQIGVFFLRFES